MLENRGWQIFSVKGQIENILSFADHTVFVMTVKLCHCSMKVAIDSMKMKERGCVPINLFYKDR